MEKTREEIAELYEERLNTSVANLLISNSLFDSAFDTLHFVELSLRGLFYSSGIALTRSDLRSKGCHLHYTSSTKREGHLNLVVRQSGIYEINIVTPEEEVSFHRLFDLLDWWSGKKKLSDFHPDSYVYRERDWKVILREEAAKQADIEIKRLKEYEQRTA